MSDAGQEPEEGIRIHDRRRIDPETYEVREQATPAPASEADEAAVLEADLSDADATVAELTDDLRRVHAEYANYRKRVERDRETARDVTVSGVLTDLLPLLDDVARAREHGELDGAFRAVGEGLEATCARLGLEALGEVGEPFDPAVHEALTSEERDGVDIPTVVAVYQPGFRHAGRVLRPARVAVAGA